MLDAQRTRPADVLPAIHALVADRLDGVEQLFRAELASPLAIVDEIGTFVAEAGGKRVRPTLHLLAARMCGYDGPHDVRLACVLEFIHSATLVHDDIIDEADVRRGRPSVHYRWGNQVTVLFGDWLYAKAMQMALQADSLPVMRALADVTLRMVEGELLQTRTKGRLDLGSAEYFDLIERKTAGLFSCCCRLAGELAGAGAEQMQALTRYGRDLGLAFQLVDDLLDLTGNPTVLGKPAGSDLRDGKLTLPVIDLLERHPDERVLVEATIGGDAASFERLSRRLAEGGCLQRTRARAEEHAAAARRELDHFAASPARTALAGLPELVIFRDR